VRTRGGRRRSSAAADGHPVRVRGGSRQVLDGPYADTKEQLGGNFLIEAAHLDAAVAWAEKRPSVTRGSVEIRPVMTREADAARRTPRASAGVAPVNERCCGVNDVAKHSPGRIVAQTQR